MKHFTLLLFLSIFCFKLSYSQSTTEQVEQVYVLEFPKMEQQKVKPLVAILRPLFEKAPQFDKDNYAVFYYKTDKDISKESIDKSLKDSGYSLLKVNVITLKEFEKEHEFELY